jgi:hypothetical protein
VRGREARGIGLLDVVVVLALGALLVYLVRLDWKPAPTPAAPPTSTTAPAAHGFTHSSSTSV